MTPADSHVPVSDRYTRPPEIENSDRCVVVVADRQCARIEKLNDFLWLHGCYWQFAGVVITINGIDDFLRLYEKMLLLDPPVSTVAFCDESGTAEVLLKRLTERAMGVLGRLLSEREVRHRKSPRTPS